MYSQTIKRKNYALQSDQRKAALILCAPSLLFIFIFIIIPFFMSVAFSFTNRMMVPKLGRSMEFVGLANYVKMAKSSTARQAFANTGLYAVLVVPAIVFFGTILAVFVNKQMKGVKFFRALYFSPQVVTMTVVAVVFSFIFSPGKTGLLNSFLGIFGLPAQTWLQDPHWAMFCIAVMYIWQSLGLQMIIILGGLQYIPEELYEASNLDGCNAVQKFIYVTIPLLKNTMVYVLISVTISTLKLFTQVYVLTNGGPQNSTTSVVYFLYKAGFLNNQVGYASAIAVVFFLLVLVISLVQNYLVKEK